MSAAGDHLMARPALWHYHRDTYDCDRVAFIHKTGGGPRATQLVSHPVVENVAGRTAIVIDGMINTAGIICEAIEFVKPAGARSVLAATSRGLLISPIAPGFQRLGDVAVRPLR